MPARILVVDDVLPNVKLLDVKLSSEYYDVLTAMSGPEALEIVRADKPDLVLLDVMMPGMDGFEVCRRIKADPETAHIPIVMVTALNQVEDRVQGLEAGADDFLTKPVDDVALLARVRSLLRLKMIIDELRMRGAPETELGSAPSFEQIGDEAVRGSRILIVEDRAAVAKRILDAVSGSYRLTHEPSGEAAEAIVKEEAFDLVIVSLSLSDYDGLRLCSHIRSTAETRQLPILVIAEDGKSGKLVRALDLGVNDYLITPLDRNELLARMRSQLIRKRYQEKLRENISRSLEMAVTDGLTGLFDRRYLMTHLENLLSRAADTKRQISVLLLDIDYFKSVNDNHGHDVGDYVLKEIAKRIVSKIRGADIACRYGGEEFAVVMPDAGRDIMVEIAERVRAAVSDRPIYFDPDAEPMSITVSVGVASFTGRERAEALLKRADQALYAAKREGRNRVAVADFPSSAEAPRAAAEGSPAS